MLTLIAAHDKNRAIGKDGQIPWHAPEDLKMFRKITEGGTVIMGRKTFDSLPGGPLKGRQNVVITRGEHGVRGGVIFCSFDEALTIARETDRRCYCIGGGEIYRQMLPHASEIIVTEVDAEIEGADAFFPEVDPDAWEPVYEKVIRAKAPVCVIRPYVRKGPIVDQGRFGVLYERLAEANRHVSRAKEAVSVSGDMPVRVASPLLSAGLMFISVTAIAKALSKAPVGNEEEKIAALSVLRSHMLMLSESLSGAERAISESGISGVEKILSALSDADLMIGAANGIVESLSCEVGR